MNDILFNLCGIMAVGCIIIATILTVSITRNMIELQSIGGSLFEALTGIEPKKFYRSATIAISKM